MQGDPPASLAPSWDAALQPATVETHVSVLFFVGDRAYKVKKPVAMGFLDFTRREARERACRREVELNRRLSPDVYLGVLDLRGPDGEPCEHLVVMRRMPTDRRLAALVRRGHEVKEGVRQVARLMAAFHSRAETSSAIASTASVEAVLGNWEDNLAQMVPFVGTILDEHTAGVVAELARRYLAGRRPLFEERMAGGFIRDGHGDLLAEDIFLLDDGPRVLDCIEFADRYRYGDVLADVAFLAMDLERLGTPGLSENLMRWYDEFSGHVHPWTLVDHYIAYRAHVRAKVMCLRHAQGGDSGVGLMAGNLLELARRHLERSRVMLVLVGGLPGTGKSTLATGLADARRWAYLSSDEVRKDMAGMGHTTPAEAEYETGLYSPDRIEAVYGELLERARRCLGLGVPVVLDASWRRSEWRQRAAEVAAATSSDLVELQCLAPTEVAVERMTRRRLPGQTTSDADPGIAARMAASFDSWDSALPIYTTGPPAAAVRAALLAVASAVGDSRQVTEAWIQGP